MSTWAARLAADRKRLVLWFTIQGIDEVFLERDIDASTILGETRTELVCIVKDSLDLGEEAIDLDKLCHKGGDFRVQLRQGHGSTVLDDLFQTRKRRQTTLTAAISKTDVTMAVADNTWATSDTGIIYLGSETIKHTTRPTGTSFGGLTRAMFGSRAQVHKGSGDFRGTAIYDVAPFWIGRRITVRASILNEDGTTNAAKTTTLGTYRINDNPTRLSANVWELAGGPLSDEYASRKLYVGFRDAQGLGTVTRVSTTSNRLTIQLDDARTFLPSPAGFVTHALIYWDNWRRSTARVYARDIVSEPHEIEVIPDDYFTPSAFRDLRIEEWRAERVRHIVLVRGLPASALLPALCSELGDSANGSYDVLPGESASSFGLDGFQMGAGIDEDDVDEAAFLAITNNDWCYILDKPVSVGDFLGEWALFADAFWYVTAAGLLSAQTQSETTAASVMTFDSSVLVADEAPKVLVEESSIYPLVEIKTNYDPAVQDFLIKHVTPDSEMMRRYAQRNDVRKVEAKGIAINRLVPGVRPRFQHPSTQSEETVRNLARSWQKAEGRGRLIVRCTTRLKGLKASIGDVVTIGFTVPDFEGGSLSGREARVIGRRPRLKDGRVDFTLQVLEPLFLFAPSCTVTAVGTTSIANDTVTLSTTAPDVADTTPTDDFVVGGIVRLWDVSAGTSQEFTIAAIPDGTHLQFTAGVAGAVQTGVDWLTWTTLGDNTAAGNTANGNNEGDWAFHMDDDAVPAAGAVRRWR